MVKKSACGAEDQGSIPGSGRSIREGNGNPLQCSCWRSPWTEEPGGLQSDRTESDTSERLSLYFSALMNYF